MLNRWACNSSANSLPTANLEALFYSDTGVTNASGVASLWADQSGFGRDYAQATGANQPIYLPYSGTKYAYHPKINGCYYSTPDSAALRATQDLTIEWYGTLDTVTPPSGVWYCFVEKMDASAY